ncbi:hypothetical protein [Rossellomorea marisflavi]|uniref:hypothetical protein n=1 Tax=Rossellomorea marisflavi TaxID=189381 RepID=UPI003F9EDFB5
MKVFQLVTFINLAILTVLVITGIVTPVIGIILNIGIIASIIFNKELLLFFKKINKN